MVVILADGALKDSGVSTPSVALLANFDLVACFSDVGVLCLGLQLISGDIGMYLIQKFP